jgi:hypothetical protein
VGVWSGCWEHGVWSGLLQQIAWIKFVWRNLFGATGVWRVCVQRGVWSGEFGAAGVSSNWCLEQRVFRPVSVWGLGQLGVSTVV